eukprot:2053034-Pyramimonas_sp.AAC.1
MARFEIARYEAETAALNILNFRMLAVILFRAVKSGDVACTAIPTATKPPHAEGPAILGLPT